MVEALTDALTNLLTVQHVAYLSVGVLLGLSVGVFPGLGGIAGLSLVLPFIYGMDEVSALAMLVGLVAIIPTSDTFTSVLMGIPGSSASQATVLDGFPLAKQGHAAQALGAAFSASLFGGLFGALILTVFVLIARPLILTFGSAELFMLAVLGLSMVGVLAGSSLVKGLAACGIGLVFGSLGGAPATGEFRMSFGLFYLYDGLPLVVVGLAIFALPEIVDLLRQERSIAKGGSLGAGWIDGLRDMVRNWWLCLRCAGLGAVIGAVPGLGGSVVDWIAYGHVVQTSRDKSGFGRGDIRGVLAPESANNAKEGGGLMPTLLFGIPGSGSMAIFLGGMILIGIEPGPSMVGRDLDLTYTVIWSLALANVLGAGLCLVLSGFIARLTTVRYALLAPFMIMVISFAAFQATRDLMDLTMLFLVGVLGVGMKRFGWPRPAFLIGFVLASRAETYLYQAVQFYGWGFFARPGVLIIGAITIASVWLGSRQRVGEGTTAPGREPPPAPENRWPQVAFTGVILALALYALVDAWQKSFLGGIFPLGVGVVTAALAGYLICVLLAGERRHAANYDAEVMGEHADDPSVPSLMHYLLWLGGLFALTAVIGFYLAIVAFFLLFLTVEARSGWVRTLVLTGSAAIFLALLADLLVLEYPRGYLQQYVDLPWPIG